MPLTGAQKDVYKPWRLQMATTRISEAVVRQILTLGDQQKNESDIAQILNLKKTQVSAILAHHRLRVRASTVSLAEEERVATPQEEQARHPSDGNETAPPEPVTVAPEVLASDEEETESRGRDQLYVGEDKDYSDPLFWEPMNTSLVQNPHLMIMGESGSGKTYATQCLVAELAQRDLPSIVFDYGQSFERENLDPTFLRFTSVQEHLIGEQGLAINPLQIFGSDIHGPKTVATRISDVFDAVYRLGDIQRKVLIDAILAAFEKVGVKDTEPKTWHQSAPTLAHLEEVLESLSSDREYPNYKNAASAAARLTTFFMLASFRSDMPPWSWDALLKQGTARVNILQFRGLEGKTQRATVELLLWHLFFYLKSSGQSPLRLYCVLDEAHHLSFRDSGPVDSLLREARKFGLGIIFASQQPEDFSPAAYSNSASKLVFQTTDPTRKVSRFLSAKCENYSSPDELADLIAILPRGHGFFISKNKGHVVVVADLKKRAALWDQDQK